MGNRLLANKTAGLPKTAMNGVLSESVVDGDIDTVDIMMVVGNCVSSC